ncbi:CheF family chemotaxis protein [Halohasta salina]|uniref:CheF family chemotaxis protein n=1 Tax=Halohasta salina TaxID=2961621 RepID=UPI0020A28D30|nr:CheF family chemotaxis protein [Halohasta salina]
MASRNLRAAEPAAASIRPAAALEPSAFYSVYRGGLSLPDDQQRLRASAVVLLSGRLGLYPGEIQHLHEAWVDWGRGELVVPERDPCACQQCWEAARRAQRLGDGRSLLEIIGESTWSPPGGGRTIPFGWSERLTAVIGALVEEADPLALSAEAMTRLVDRSARRAEGVDHEAVGFDSLRATAISFFADAGFPAARIAHLAGTDPETARAFTGREGGDARERLSELFDGGIADPGGSYGLVADPEPFDAEPVDPREYDDEWRQRRMRQRANAPEALQNPRPVADALNRRLDPSDLGTRRALDADSDLVDPDSATARLDEWVHRREADRRGTAGTAHTAEASATPSTGKESGGSSGTTGEPAGVGARSAGAADNAAAADTTAAATGGSGAAGSTADLGANAEETAVEEAAVFNPREELSGPPELTVETTVACSEFAGGRPTETRVFLGPEELLLVQADDSMAPEYTRIELSGVVDLSPDYIPEELADSIESAVTVAYERGGDQRLAVVELRGNRRVGFANAVFKAILTGCDAIVTHPARRGGRVLNTEPVEARLSVDDRSVSITPDDGERLGITLSEIIHFELEKQDFEDKRYRGLSVRHLGDGGMATKTTIALEDDRKHKLFQRFVRRGYRERKAKIEEISLEDAHKEVLVALYSAGDQFDISMIVDKSADKLQQLLGSLGEMGLVRIGDSGATLTGLGRIVVNEKLDDVNM